MILRLLAFLLLAGCTVSWGEQQRSDAAALSLLERLVLQQGGEIFTEETGTAPGAAAPAGTVRRCR